MNAVLKNIRKGMVLSLKDEITYQNGQIVSKTLVQNDAISMTLFSLAKGEEISSQESKGDAIVTVLEGKGRFTIEQEIHLVEEGETLIMPAEKAHSVYADDSFKMLFTIIF